MRDTSNLAYKHITESGDADSQRGRIYRFLLSVSEAGTDATRREISRALRIDLCAVCGRINELIKEGSVEELARRECSVSGYMAHPLRAKK